MLSHRVSFPFFDHRRSFIADEGVSFASGGGLSRSLPFVSWAELQRFLESELQLEAAAISLQPEFVGAESADSLGELSACPIDGRSLLIELTVGFRVRLATHLIRPADDRRSEPWLPRSMYRYIARAALDVYAHSVAHRIVALATGQETGRLVSVYLDAAGGVVSTTGDAGALEAFFGNGGCNRDRRLFPSETESYLAGLMRRLERDRRRKDQGLVFALRGQRNAADCQLRRLTDGGFLLSVALDA